LLVVRFKIRYQPDKTEQLEAAMARVVAAARTLTGVVHFDIGRDITDPHVLIVTEVFESREAMERQENMPEAVAVMELMQSGALAGQPEWTIYEVASSESPAM
jgi:quinol monooxygenase YgiN